MHNKIRSPEEFISKIDSVQLEDLEKARKNILNSNLTVSSIGPIEHLETADLIKRRLS
jgi:predicted Zn-dependent peptidase